MRKIINIVESDDKDTTETKLPGGWEIVAQSDLKRVLEKQVGDVLIRRIDGYVESRSRYTRQGLGYGSWKTRVFKVIFPDGQEKRALTYKEALDYAKDIQ